jgi:predicted small secreted protein
MRLLLFIMAACSWLAACETVKGVGRDIESVGEAADDIFLTDQ